MAYPMDEAVQRLRSSSRSFATVDALAVTTAELGDAAMANVYLLGVAVQRGMVPVGPQYIEEAIGLNGVSVEKNLTAFRMGRRDAAAPQQASPAIELESVDGLIHRLADDLRSYQSSRYAARFTDQVDRTTNCGSEAFTRAVAVNLHRLMAYKDEYEVARLLLAPETRAAAEAVGGPGAKVSWNLHPPALRSMGLQRKIRLGRWATPAMVALRSGKRVRGTPLDVFGMAKVRRIERAMIDEYIDAVGTLVQRFDEVGADECVAIAQLPETVRGYEDLKLRRAEA